MIVLKTRKEVELMRDAGSLLASVLERMEDMASPGMTTGELDREADRIIREAGGIATFRGQGGMVKHAPPYPAASCISINEQVIHGIPSDRRIKEGDLISIDCGVTLHSLIADSALTFVVGRAAPEV
ncbi:MAG: M24 family metallopeptidase, partial [Deltaproteobacteria bacterium]|nr:M24 family metallopeptidase [Deltaproteobacteria bacterium]